MNYINESRVKEGKLWEMSFFQFANRVLPVVYFTVFLSTKKKAYRFELYVLLSSIQL